MWLATPTTHRFPLNEDEFIRSFRTSPEELALIRAEPGFWKSVTGEMAPWLDRVNDVKAAILKNALDGTRDDQWLWMQRYEQMLGIQFLPGEEGD